jgi:hypothetical protein
MISAGDLKLFHFVETAEEAWALAEHYGFDAPPTVTGEFADRHLRAMTSRHQPDRRAHRHRRRHARRQHGPRGAARGRPAGGAGIARPAGDRPRQPGGPANPWLPPVDGYRHLAEVVAWNQAVHDAVHAELQQGRLPILLGGDHCLAIGSISAVARHCRAHRPQAARAVAGRACRLQHRHPHAQRQPARHAGGLPVRPWPAGAGGDRRPVPAISPKWCARSASAAWTRARSASCTKPGWRCSTCATSTRWACATPMELALATLDAEHPPARQLRRGLPRPRDRPRRGHHRARRPHLPRGAAVHGDDRRHRPPGQPGRDGAQPGAGRAQQDRPAGGGPDREPVRQEHADARRDRSPGCTAPGAVPRCSWRATARRRRARSRVPAVPSTRRRRPASARCRWWPRAGPCTPPGTASRRGSTRCRPRCSPPAPGSSGWMPRRRSSASRCCGARACSARCGRPTRWISTSRRCTRGSCAARGAGHRAVAATPHWFRRRSARTVGIWPAPTAASSTCRVLVNAAGLGRRGRPPLWCRAAGHRAPAPQCLHLRCPGGHRPAALARCSAA